MKFICKLCKCPDLDKIDDYCTDQCRQYFSRNEEIKVNEGKSKSDKEQKPLSNLEWEKSFNPKK